jgi:hypothetical protein
MPWQVIYTEQAGDYRQARNREKYLKTAAGKIFLLIRDESLFLEIV